LIALEPGGAPPPEDLALVTTKEQKTTSGDAGMDMTRRLVLGSAAATAAATLRPRRAGAQAANTIRIGVLTDLSGPYSHLTRATVAATKLAAADAASQGFSVEVVAADHQNKPDVGAGIAREWFDRDGVDVVSGLATSSVALAVAGVGREKDKPVLVTGAGTMDLTGKQCAPTTVHWTFDVYMLAKSTGGATVRAGGDSWFFISADYVFGHQLQDFTTGFVTAAGGKVLGAVNYPFPQTVDFSHYLLQAQASGAKVIGLANAGADTINCIKQAHEFGLKARLATLLMFIPDVHALGLEAAQGLTLTESFYWDMNDRTRAFTRRLQQLIPPTLYPHMGDAFQYASVLHYLKAVQKIGAPAAKASGSAAVAAMKAMPTEDDAFGSARIREDGKGMVPTYLFEVKSPAESKAPWDYYKLLVTAAPDEAWRPLAEGRCAFLKT
jgi:branched-chain amino acid transport system substrate-binding protein